MPQVFIPPAMRDLIPEQEAIRADDGTVRAVIDQLDIQYPGLKTRLVDDNGKLRAGISVSVNGAIASLGLRHSVNGDDEVHFLPAIAGG
jgi:molybdopterin converting factor small subunit